MASEKTPVVWDDDAKKHRPLGSGEKMGGLSASSMISSDSGNLLQQGSDGLMLVTGGSIADPRADNLLEESENGKLQVTSDRVVEWLEGHPQAAAALAEAVKVVSEDSGNVVVQGSDKGAFMSKEVLTSAVSTMTTAQMSALADALRKAGGGLNVDPSTGKLVVDFGSMDPNIMRSVVLSMVQQGGGIAVDQSGKLYVDFDSMPTAKFESLLKSLKMQIPLEANLDLYVDAASDGDSLVDGRGTQAKPFKTIAACVNYATSTYAVGSYGIFIHIADGVYNTSGFQLPDFTHTSGSVRLYGSGNTIITNTNPVQNLIAIIGGTWYLHNLTFRNIVSTPTDNLPHYVEAITVYSGRCVVENIKVDVSYVGDAYSNNIGIRGIVATGNAIVDFLADPSGSTSFHMVKGYATSAQILHIDSNSIMHLNSSNVAPVGDMYKIYFSGTVSDVVRVQNNSNFSAYGGGQYTISLEVPSGKTLTGRKFNISTSSFIGLYSTTEIPGTDEGIVDAETFCYYV